MNLFRLRNWNGKLQRLYLSLEDSSSQFNATPYYSNTLQLIHFYCYTVHVVELLNYYTNYCTYIKFIRFTH